MHLACLAPAERATFALSPLERELPALVLTALAESKGFLSLQSNGITHQLIPMNAPHFSLQKYFTMCNPKLLLHSKQAKLKNHLVPVLLAVRKHGRLFVWLPGKPIYLLSVGSISSRVSIGRAWQKLFVWTCAAYLRAQHCKLVL